MPKHEIDTREFLFDGSSQALSERLPLAEKSVADRVSAMSDEQIAAVEAESLGASLGAEFSLRVPRLDLAGTRVERVVLDTVEGLVPNALRVSIPFTGDGSLFGVAVPLREGDTGEWRIVRWCVEKSELHLFAGLAGEDPCVGSTRGAELGNALRGLQQALRELEDLAAAWNATLPGRAHEALHGRQSALRSKADFLAAFREALIEAVAPSLPAPALVTTHLAQAPIEAEGETDAHPQQDA